jgi:hypothetical protein
METDINGVQGRAILLFYLLWRRFIMNISFIFLSQSFSIIHIFCNMKLRYLLSTQGQLAFPCIQNSPECSSFGTKNAPPQCIQHPPSRHQYISKELYVHPVLARGRQHIGRNCTHPLARKFKRDSKQFLCHIRLLLLKLFPIAAIQ